MKKINSIIGLVFLTLLILILSFSYISIKGPVNIREESATEATGPILYMSPGINSKQLGESFNIDLYLDAKTERASASDITVTYNPAILKANSVTLGNFLPVVLKPSTINNGTITLSLGVAPTDPKTGVGKLATVNFTTLSYGTDTINYQTTTELAVISQTTSFISSLTGAIVTIESPTPTPTLTPVPTSTTAPLPTEPNSTPIPTPIVATMTPAPSVTPAGGSVITVYAAGTKAGHYPYYPNMSLIIEDHTVLQAMAVSGNPLLRQFVKYTYNSPVKLTPNQVRVSFTNDYYDRRHHEDRNLMIDKIEIDGIEYQAEAENVYTKYSRHSGCHSGFKKSEWLYCNGYLAF